MPRPVTACLIIVLATTLLAGCHEKEPAVPDTSGAPASATPTRVQSAAVAQRLGRAQSAARSHPNDVVAQMNLARLAYDGGSYNDAYRAYKRAVDLDAKNYEALVGLAKTNLRLENPTEGLDWLLRAKHLKPGDVQLKDLEARLLLVNGNFDRAIATFQEAIKMNPERAATWLNLASAYALMNREDDAVRAAQAAVAIDKDDPISCFALGNHLERTGDTAGAEAQYRHALAHDAANAPTMIALAHLLMGENRRLEEARQLAIKASQIRADRSDAAVIAAWILHLQGDDRKCANELIKLVNANPQTPEAWQKLAIVLRNIDKPVEAKRAEDMAQRFIATRRNSADLNMLDSDATP